MTSDFLLGLQGIWRCIWPLVSGWEFPGTHMTPAEWGFFCLFFGLCWRFFGNLFNVSVGAAGAGVRRSRRFKDGD